MQHAYLGPGFSNDDIQTSIQAAGLELNSDFRIEKYSENELIEVVVDALDKGAVIGWFQGRMEWGPRALGNRSILADPRRTDMQELLNRKIKRRESFRPFAPSILEQDMADWFEIEDQVPYMEKVYPIKREKQSLIPAVTHVDGTGRLQTVNSQTNPRYYRLIEKFSAVTGVPILLNTSFNENEPVVCNPDQAIDCFVRTRMDMLVIEDFVISRVEEK